MAIIIKMDPLWPVSGNDFIIKRVLRVVPLYWLISLVVACFQLKLTSVDINSLLKSVLIFPLFDKANFIFAILPQGWTLAFELYFYFIIYLFLKARRRNTLKCVILALLVLAAIGYFIRPQSFIFNFLTSPFLIEFAIGLLIGKFYAAQSMASISKNAVSFKSFAVFALIVGLLLTLGSIFIDTSRIYDIDFFAKNPLVTLERVLIWGLPCALFLFGLTFCELLFNMKIAKAFITLGDASYSCYLIHFYILQRLNNFFTRHQYLNPDIQILLFATLTILLSIPVYRHVEKPLLKTLKRALKHSHPMPR